MACSAVDAAAVIAAALARVPRNPNVNMVAKFWKNIRFLMENPA